MELFGHVREVSRRVNEDVDLLNLGSALVEEEAALEVDDSGVVEIDVVVVDRVVGILDHTDDGELCAAKREDLADRIVGTVEVERELLTNDGSSVRGCFVEELPRVHSELGNTRKIFCCC